MNLNIEKIEQRRVALHISKAELANRAGISKQLLNYYFKNPEVINNVSVIAQALGLKAKSILVE